MMLRQWVIVLLGLWSMAASAGDSLKAVAIPSGEIATALQKLAQQTGVEFFYSVDDLKGIHTKGVTGQYTAEQAVKRLLEGTPLKLSVHESGAYLIAAPNSSAILQSPQHQWPDPSDTSVQLRVAQAQSVGTSSAASSQQASKDDSRAVSSGIEEIIVTAQKREERAQDVPMSIAVVGGQEIERRGLIGMEDYLRSIPGVNQIDNGPSSNAIVIRGIATSPESENYNSGTTVAAYFDETPITAAGGLGAGGVDVRPVDIERIELLRGPQGTAYGDSSLGGTLRMIPVKPKLDAFGAKLVASYSDTGGEGSDNSMFQGIVNLPVVAGKLALRAVGYRYEESGFYRNTAGTDPASLAIANVFGLTDFVRDYVREDVGRMVSTGGRVAALWQVTEKLDLSMNFLTQTIEQDGAPLASIGSYRQVRPPVSPQGRARGEQGETADTDMDLLNLVMNYGMSWGTLTSALSWVNSGSLYTFADFAPFPFSSYTPSDYKTLTFETRVASQFKGRFQFLGGVFYQDIEDVFHQNGDWAGSAATNPAQTDPMFTYDSTRKIDQRALFGELSYGLTHKLTATVGARYFEYDKEQSLLSEGGFFLTPIGTGVTQHLENSKGDSSFKANLSYKPTLDALLYASWAQGFRLGRPQVGLRPQLCDRDNNGVADGTSISIESTRTVNSDFLDNYELGGKFTLFDRRMTVNASVYHIEWDGLPVVTVLACGDAYVANAGAATSDGAELQSSVFVTEGLRLDFGAGYTKAQLAKDAPSLNARKGARLPGSPEVSINLGAQYEFDLAGHKAFVRADSFYTGEFYAALQESPNVRAGDYIKVDARAGMELRNLSIELFVRNLTDEDAFTWRSAYAGFGNFAGYQMRPRTVGVQLGYSFGR